jgi:transposase
LLIEEKVTDNKAIVNDGTKVEANVNKFTAINADQTTDDPQTEKRFRSFYFDDPNLFLTFG